jgi:hypothetical protein
MCGCHSRGLENIVFEHNCISSFEKVYKKKTTEIVSLQYQNQQVEIKKKLQHRIDVWAYPSFVCGCWDKARG